MHHKTFFVLSISLAGLVLVAACGQTPTPQISTNSGPVQGVIDDGVAIYRGIPYAGAPVGDLRWRAPQPPEPWTEPLAATDLGPACWQDNAAGNALFMERLTKGGGMGGFTQWLLTTLAGAFEQDMAEDCLTLNVMAPAEVDAPLPVMFWLHGGGHQFGSGGGPYESPTLASRGVVLVSINYRLGLYGFFAHPELAAEDPHGSTGNYGMLDQIAALQWVQDNITQFGGDPNNVTVFGESAGGHSVGQLMASPLARALFHRAIAQSGTGYSQFQATDAAHERLSGYAAGRKLANLAGVSGDNEIAALRTLSVAQLQPWAIHAELSGTYHPQIDGYVLPDSTARIFAAGQQAKVPLLVGSNADEGSVLYYFGLAPVDGGPQVNPTTMAEWDTLLTDQFGDQAENVSAHYAVDTDVQVEKAAAALMGDSWFGRHAYYMAQDHAAAGHPTYLYFYARRPPSEAQTIGASHALELNHVFGGFIPFWPSDDRDDELSGEMQAYWTRFAAAGDPNGPTLPKWQAFDAITRQEMAFGHEQSHSRTVARAPRYEAMRGQFLKRMQNLAPGAQPGRH